MLSGIIKNYISQNPKKASSLPLSKKEENSKNESPKKSIKIKEEQKEEDGQNKNITPRNKAIDTFKQMLKTTKNESTLKEIYKSLETSKNFEMSALKNPPNLEKPMLGLNILQQQKVNYPLSAIGLLQCNYGNGLTMYGTGTLINFNMVLTCAHVLYSPILKKRCESAIFYLNLSDGKYLDCCKVETFVTPDEYETNLDEKYDYALCVLGEDIGKKGGYFGLCVFNEKEDKTGYIYGYSNKKSTNNFLSSFKTNVNEYEIMGVKSYVRYIEEEKILIYVGNKTKIGQDGSPVFKIIDFSEKDKKKEKKDNEKSKDEEKNELHKDMINNIKENLNEKREIQNYDVKIFAIDCSMTSTEFQEVDNLILENDENILIKEMVYVRNHKAIVIDEAKFEQITNWIKFYENIMPRGKIDNHIHKTKSVFNAFYDNIKGLSGGLVLPKQKENTILSINCCDLRGKDLLMLLNSNFDISQLTILDLSNNSINYEGMRWLTFQKDLCYNLIELNLSENLLDCRAAKYLTKVEFRSLDILNISKNDLGPLGASILAAKGNFPNLTELNIAENFLMKEGAKGLKDGSAFKGISKLNIFGNDINDYGFYLLSEGEFNQLKELYLGANKIGDDALTYISRFKELEILHLDYNSLTYKGVNNICGKYFKEIKSLNLDNNAIGVEGTYLIASYIGNELKKLSLVKNDICTKGAELISIMNLTKLESINISDNFINDLGFYFICKGKFENLKELDVSLNKISDKGLIYLTEANFTETLTLLNLAGNDITDSGTRSISFCKMPELETLNLSVNYLQSKTGSHLSKCSFDLLSSLSLERNKIKSIGLSNIVTAKFFSNLVKLNLGYCRIGNDGCQILAEANVAKIINLNLKDDNIDDDGVVSLCKGNWKNLKDINLEDNNIGKIGIDAIINSFLTQLSFLRLKGNKKMDNKDLARIYDKVGTDSQTDNEHKYTFLNYSQINYGAIRYCIRHPEFMKKQPKDDIFFD